MPVLVLRQSGITEGPLCSRVSTLAGLLAGQRLAPGSAGSGPRAPDQRNDRYGRGQRHGGQNR
jgi:hypothetical protein